MDAQGYLASFSPEEQARIKQSLVGNPNGLNDWFAAASNAGAVPGTTPRGTQAGMLESGWEDPTGKYTTTDFTGVATPDQWMGKRAPTAAEARLWAQQQHQAYTGGNRSAQDEDWARYSDQQIQAWLNEGWDPQKGGWKQGYDAHGQIMPWAQSGTTGTTAALPAAATPQAGSPQIPDMTAILAQYQQPQQPQVTTGQTWGGAQLGQMQSSLQGLLNPAQKQQTQAAPITGTTGTGWTSTGGGLQNMLAPLQKRRVGQGSGSWF